MRAPSPPSNMMRCGRDWHGRYRCRSPSCASCLKSHRNREARRALRLLVDSGAHYYAAADVFLGSANVLDEVPRVLRKGIEDLRARFKACRRQSSEWDRVRLLGWLQVAPCDRHVNWCCWMNVVGFFPYADSIAFALALSRQWGEAVSRTHFRSGRMGECALQSYVHERAGIHRGSTGWAPHTVDEWYAWLSSMNRRNTFEPFRFKVGCRPASQARAECRLVEPMHCSFLFSGDPVFFVGGH